MRISGVWSHDARTRFARSVAAVGSAILLGGLVAAIVPATAGAHSCDSGIFCAWDTNVCNSHAQDHEMFSTSSRNWPGIIDDDEDCVRNREAASVSVYDSVDFADFHYCIFQGHTVTLPENKDGDGNSHQVGVAGGDCF